MFFDSLKILKKFTYNSAKFNCFLLHITKLHLLKSFFNSIILISILKYVILKNLKNKLNSFDSLIILN